MPSTSEKQAHLMAAACHDADFAKKVDIPQKVACEFNKADEAKAAKKKRKSIEW